MDKIKFNEAIKYLFASKGKTITDEIVPVWYDILKDYPEEKTLIAIKKLAMNSKEFINAGMVIELMGEDDGHRAEKEWAECLASAKSGGSKQISARAGKAIKSLGGIKWLGNNDPKDVSFNKRDFIASYKNTPEPIDTDFRCPGLVAPMYLECQKNIQQLEG